MKHRFLHDAAKVGVGLVVADMITFWWLSAQNTLPHSFLGLPITSSMILPGMIFDFFLVLALIHYGWNIGKMPQVKERLYLVAAGAIFTVVAFVHLARILYQGELTIFGWTAPLFLSWLGVAAATYLAYASFHFASRMKSR